MNTSKHEKNSTLRALPVFVAMTLALASCVSTQVRQTAPVQDKDLAVEKEPEYSGLLHHVDEALLAALHNLDLASIKNMLANSDDPKAKNQPNYVLGHVMMNTSIYKPTPELVTVLLEAGADIHDKNGYGRNTLLAGAIDYDNLPLVKFALEAGANPNEPDTFYKANALHYAANYAKDVKILEALLEHGADIDAQDERGWTALMYALAPGWRDRPPDLEHLSLLINAGADLQLANEEAQDALLFAVVCDASPEIIHFVWNAVLESTPERLQDPAHLARLLVWTDKDNEEFFSTLSNAVTRLSPVPLYSPYGYSQKANLMSLLLRMGVAADSRDGRGRTLLTTASSFADTTLLRILLDAKADVNACSDTGWTPLMAAAYEQGPDIVRILLEAGADVNATNHYGNTALHFAAGYNPDFQSAITLLRAGADLHARNEKNATPLHYATSNYKNKSLDLAWLLFKLGADIHARDSVDSYHVSIGGDGRRKTEGRNLLLLVLSDVVYHVDFFRELLDADADKTLTPKERADVVIMMYRAGIDEERVWKVLLRGVDCKMEHVLKAAAGNASPELIAFLLKHGAPVDPKITPYTMSDSTALENAVQKENWRNVELLLKAGAKVKKNDLRYRYPLLALARIDGALTPEIICRFHAADPYQIQRLESETRKTPLILAAEHYSHPAIITTLLNLGADPNAKDAEGKTALDYLRANKKLNKSPALSALQRAK